MEIRVPSVGESITEGTLARWFKRDGEAVQADEPLFELETEKATTEVRAPAAGRLRIGAAEGATVTVGAVVAQIQEGQPSAAEGPKSTPDGKAAVGQSAPASAPASERPKATAESRASPSARRLAEEHAVSLASVQGSGRGGRITKEDVQAQLEPPKKAAGESKPGSTEQQAGALAMRSSPPVSPAQAGSSPRETRQRMSAVRQRIAARLVSASTTAAILTTFNEADLTGVLDLRARYKDSFRERYGLGLGFMSFFVKSCVEALRAFPIVNARIDGNEIVFQHFYDIGVAVSTDKGLMVPVVREADRLSFAEIEKQIATFAQKARDGKIEVADLQGGTFTITNGGVFGSLLSTPILNAPQSAILGMHTIQKRPVALGDQVVVRPMMYLALSYDHRLIDGREAVQFLVRVKQCIEDPERLLLEV